jgi:hypothetical protein
VQGKHRQNDGKDSHFFIREMEELVRYTAFGQLYNSVQLDIECCGVFNASDYPKAEFDNRYAMPYPYSCCPRYWGGSNEKWSLLKDHNLKAWQGCSQVYPQGCHQKLKQCIIKKIKNCSLFSIIWTLTINFIATVVRARWVAVTNKQSTGKL